MDPYQSPRKQPSDSFRRNPYASPRKKPLDRSPTKKVEFSPSKKPQETKKVLSPRKEPNYETSPKRKAAEITQRKLKNEATPTKEAISPRKKPGDGKSPRKENQTKTLEVVNRDNWKFPSERSPDTQPEDEIAKPKKKEHPLIQEYDPDVHGAEFERTLVLIKPTALHKSRAVEQVIKRHGLLLLKRKRCRLRPDTVRDFYLGSLDEQDNKYFRVYRELVASEGGVDPRYVNCPQSTVEPGSTLEEYVDLMTSGPVELIIAAGRGAVARWKGLMGPEDPREARRTHPMTVRARIGGESVLRNGVYGSPDAERAEKEIAFFFGTSTKTQGVKEDVIVESGAYLSKNVNPVLLKGLIQLCRQKPDNPLVWLADWLLANNPNIAKAS